MSSRADDRLSIGLQRERERAKGRVIPSRPMALPEGMPHHPVTDPADASSQWPTPNLAALAAQQVAALPPVALCLAEEIGFERSISKPGGHNAAIGTGWIKATLSF